FTAEAARIETQVNANPEIDLRPLKKMLPSGELFPSIDHELIFFQAERRAKLRLSTIAGANPAFRRATRCDELRLASLSAGSERGGLLRKSEDAYRCSVLISVGRNTEDALKLWEWYRSADLAGLRRELDLRVPLPRLALEIVLSYVLSPAGNLSVWVMGDGAV